MSDTKKFQVGDRVKIAEKDRIGYVLTSDQRTGTVRMTDATNSGRYKVEIDNYDGDSLSFYPEDLSPLDKTLLNLEKGDVLVDSDGDTKTVLAVCDGLYALSDWDDTDSVDDWYTPKELEGNGWTIKQEQSGTQELSVAEVEKKLGMASGTLRIKKD